MKLWILAAASVLLAVAVGNRVAEAVDQTPPQVVDIARTGYSQPWEGSVLTRPVESLRQLVNDRAAATVTETFGAGMGAWNNANGKMAKGWSKQADGSVRTGELALFQPSRRDSDYVLEFKGQIENRSIGWVVRAQDSRNYFATKLVITEPGLRPFVAIEHYAVLNGKETAHSQTPLRVMFHNNSPYRITVAVLGSQVATSIEGEQIDLITQEMPKKGAVGFFRDQGDQARLYWVRLARNRDKMGQVCAWLSKELGDERSGEMRAAIWPLTPLPPYRQDAIDGNGRALSRLEVVPGVLIP